MTSPLTERELALTVERVKELRESYRSSAGIWGRYAQDPASQAADHQRNGLEIVALCDAWLASNASQATPPPARQELPFKLPVRVIRFFNKNEIEDAGGNRIAIVQYSNYDYDNHGALCDERADAIAHALNNRGER